MMASMDLNSLFARAEQAFAAGRLDAARADLIALHRQTGDEPAVLHLLALVEKKRGAFDAAGKAFERALTLAPRDPQINGNHANLLRERGEHALALHHYDRALAANPGFHEVRRNRALLLNELGRPAEALADLDQVIAARPRDALALSMRGTVLRALDRRAEAAAAYDAALSIEPGRAVAAHGRARVAIESGEEAASAHYRRALALAPQDPEIRLGLAEALEAEGDPESLEVLAATVAERPHWVEGQATLARMRWEAGEGAAFTRDLERAVAALPLSRPLWLALVAANAGADLAAEAADAAAAARAALGPDPELMLLEAVQASEAGQSERADTLFAALPAELAGRNAVEARHRLRRDDLEGAARLADAARQERPSDMDVWAVTALVWRLTGDDRFAWLAEQPELVDVAVLDLSTAQIGAIADRLRSLHRTRAHPIGQSLRGGTQTRGRLFERKEEEIVLLKEAVTRAVEGYWSRLPPADPAHPLLRHRDAAPRFTGSWSVRLVGGGFHVSHFHPNGHLSSACYLVVPEPSAPMEGWLEVGGPPGGLELPLAPLVQIEPAPGRLALFPSYLYHGTRPFAAGERLTAAFDIRAE